MVRRRWTLIVLLYTVNLLAALLVAVPVFRAIARHVGGTGFGPDLIRAFDLMVWRDIVDRLSDTLAGVGMQLLVLTVVYGVWRVAAHMGVIYALHNGALWPFWRGVGAYTGRGLVLALIYWPVKILWLVVCVAVASFVQAFFPGEVGAYWSLAVMLPLLVVAGFAALDLFQRYGRMAMVIRHDTIGNALMAGLTWPFRYRAAGSLYLIWFVVALLVTGTTWLLNARLHVGVSAVVLAFLIQQVSLFTRAGVMVAWTASEVALFERTYIHELPLIADRYDVDAASGEATA